MNTVTIAPKGDFISLIIADHTFRFYAIWLRNNALDKDTRSLGNGQRQIALQDIHKSTYVGHVQLHPHALTITFMPEDKSIDYPLDWLLNHAYDKPNTHDKGWHKPSQTLWNSSLMGKLPEGDFDRVSTSTKDYTHGLGTLLDLALPSLIMDQ